jgi:hypothetical protein
MNMNRKAAFAASAGMAAAFLSACSDTPTAPTAAALVPKSSFAVAGSAATATPVPSEFRVCKSGNAAGTFIVSTTPAGAGYGANHTSVSPVTVQPGTCVVVAEDDAASGSGSNVTVTESPAASLTGIAGVRISITDGISTISNPQNGFTDFINSIHGVRLTFTNEVTASGCTFTQGYYKNHETYVQNLLAGGNLNIGTLSNPFLFNAAQIDENLGTNPKGGNAFYILTHQLITAELNILGGGSAPVAVQNAIAAANLLLEDKTISAAERDQAIALAATLDAYNNGLTGPGHCD